MVLRDGKSVGKDKARLCVQILATRQKCISLGTGAA